ncbi:hypothetical protein [Ruminococcus sp.]|uniref:hypothetical protein n=1 Tax=Ruminococcus sp. TaxID=41978 RepID=UPI0035226B2A
MPNIQNLTENPTTIQLKIIFIILKYLLLEEDFNRCFDIEIGKGNIKSFSIGHYCYGEALMCSNVTTIYWNIEKIEF